MYLIPTAANAPSPKTTKAVPVNATVLCKIKQLKSINMKNKTLKFFIICVFGFIQITGFSQKVSDVLENGIKVSSGKKLFLRFEDNILKYDLQRSLSDGSIRPDFLQMEDSSIFLIEKSGINIYIQPLNPLVYEFETNIEIKTDAINDQVLKLMDGWESQINNLLVAKSQVEKKSISNIDISIPEKINAIKDSLKNDKILKIIQIFDTLKKIDFVSQKITEMKINSCDKEIKKIKEYYNKIQKDIEDLKTEIQKSTTFTFTEKYIFNQIAKELSEVLAELIKKSTALEQAFKLVESEKEKAINDPDGLQWCIKLSEVGIKEGKVAEFTIELKDANYSISSDKGVISKLNSKSLTSKKIRFRKFNRFVPEVSGGILFTFIDYNTYGIQNDPTTGNQIIALSGQDRLKNLKFSAMVNYTCFIANSNIHPFYQIGFAINSEIPTIATGFGIRSNINGLRRFTISAGISSTWVKDLDKLKIGDKVNGTADLEKDLKYQFVWPPRPYIGFQRNF